MGEYFITNFWAYDKYILIVAIINAGFFIACLYYTNRLYNHFHKQDATSTLSDKIISRFKRISVEKAGLTIEEQFKFKDNMGFLYSCFLNITSVFPLLGMLGTVLSLLSLTDLIGTESTGAFTAALTSTVWGIICAVIYKLLDSFISYKYEDIETRFKSLMDEKNRSEDLKNVKYC